jgi:hypothetical protein
VGDITAIVHKGFINTPAEGLLTTYIKEWDEGEGKMRVKKDLVFAVNEVPILSVPEDQMSDLLNLIFYHGKGFEVRKWKRWDAKLRGE